MLKIIISQITTAQTALLHTFLLGELENPTKQFWPANFKYQVVHQGESVEFTLNQHIVRVRRRNNKPGVRFGSTEADLFASGSSGKVYNIHTIRFYKDTMIIFNNKRLIKIQFDKINPLFKVEDECHMMDKAGHFGVKPLTIVRLDDMLVSFLTMQRMPGEELIAHITKGCEPPYTYLNKSNRFELSIAVAIAIKTQVADKGIIHRDLSNANVIVDNCSKKFKANVIDFGLAVEEKPPTALSAWHYYDPQLDIVSLGIQLGEIWDPFFLSGMDENIQHGLLQLIGKMQRGYGAILLPEEENPMTFPAKKLRVLMQDNHGFIQRGSHIYYVNNLMEIKHVLNNFQRLIATELYSLKTAAINILLFLEREHGFVPSEPIKKERLDLGFCIQTLQQLCLQYQSSLKDYVAEDSSMQEAKPDIPSVKTKIMGIEVTFPMHTVGFFSARKTMHPVREVLRTPMPTSQYPNNAL